jgi:hypothetical protein
MDSKMREQQAAQLAPEELALLTGEELRKIAYVACGLAPAWMAKRWDGMAEKINELIRSRVKPERTPLREALDDVLRIATEKVCTDAFVGIKVNKQLRSALKRHVRREMAQFRAALTLPPAQGQSVGGTLGLDGDTRRCCNTPGCDLDYGHAGPCAQSQEEKK